jgi:hypothetical protein
LRIGPSPFPSSMTEAVTQGIDLDARASDLRQQGLTYQAIAKWLGVTVTMARRRVLRHERIMREAGMSADRPHRSRE